MKLNFSSKGVSIYLAFMIMTVLLAMSFGLSTILFSQIKMVRETGNSVIAFYAADTGIEWLIYKDKECRDLSPNCDQTICLQGCEGLLDKTFPEQNLTNSSYQASVSNSGTIFKSVGKYKETKRAIELSRQ